ncbi:2-hydroxychromene-2-carboxylate isomerase [Massilia soli]|nr:2-hydroxychromene-2-carboxylate isomerase [Massilia soli]
MDIAIWFDFASNYSYLSVMRVEACARERGVGVSWRPFLLGPVFKSLGMDNSPFVTQKIKGAYVWTDMERQCAKYRLGWTKPTTFPRRSILPARIATLADGQTWQGEFIRQVMQLNFVEDHDMEDHAALGAILASLGQDGPSIIAAAEADAIKQQLRERTEQARLRGVFGAPTFFVGDEMFWGNDRLDDALDLAATRR